MRIRAAFSVCAAALALAGVLSAAGAAPPEGGLPEGEARFRLDPRFTFVQAEVLHFGTSTIRLRFGPVEGEVRTHRARGEGEVALRIPTASVSSGFGFFDARLRQPDLLDSTGHPEAFFVARRFRFDGAGVAEVRGEFTFRGTSQPLSLMAERFACRDDAGTTVCGGEFTAEVLRTEFGASFGVPLVGDRVRLRVSVQARRES